MQSFDKLQDFSLLVLRLITAVIFFHAGYVKWSFWSALPEGVEMSVGMWNLMKFLSVVEPIGAVAIAAGFLTRTASTGLGIIMVGAIYVMQFVMNVGFSTPTGPGWSFPLAVLGGCIVLIAFGAGNWAIDLLWRRRS